VAAANMRPVDLPGKPAGLWELEGKDGKIVYSSEGEAPPDITRGFKIQRIDPTNGRPAVKSTGPVVLWIHK